MGRTEPQTNRNAGKPDALPPMDFSGFVISLSETAMIYMGLVPNPETGQRTCDIVLAQQNIDILGLLQEKTRGNLTPEEARLLERILLELRVAFVKRCECS